MPSMYEGIGRGIGRAGDTIGRMMMYKARMGEKDKERQIAEALAFQRMRQDAGPNVNTNDLAVSAQPDWMSGGPEMDEYSGVDPMALEQAMSEGKEREAQTALKMKQARKAMGRWLRMQTQAPKLKFEAKNLAAEVAGLDKQVKAMMQSKDPLAAEQKDSVITMLNRKKQQLASKQFDFKQMSQEADDLYGRFQTDYQIDPSSVSSADELEGFGMKMDPDILEGMGFAEQGPGDIVGRRQPFAEERGLSPYSGYSSKTSPSLNFMVPIQPGEPTPGTPMPMPRQMPTAQPSPIQALMSGSGRRR